MYLYTFPSFIIDRNKNYAERSNIIGIIIVSFLYHKKPLWRLLPLVYLDNIIFSYHSTMLFTAKNVLKSAEDFVTTLEDVLSSETSALFFNIVCSLGVLSTRHLIKNSGKQHTTVFTVSNDVTNCKSELPFLFLEHLVLSGESDKSSSSFSYATNRSHTFSSEK